jgi:ComF family protein
MRSTAALIADEMFHKIPNLDSSTIVCHIPTATSRRRQRGYDQAELIATSLARKSGLQHKALLLRKGHTRQVGADKKLRSTQLKDAFYSKKDLSGIKKVLLVDDLLTTGATIEAATNVLKDAGVKKVYATTFAQRSI